MGYNTVIFCLNDNMHLIPASPRSVADLISHPHMSYAAREARDADVRRSLAEVYEEPIVFDQTVEVLPTFHASETKFLRAGQNCIVELPVVKFGKTKAGKRTVTLELPDWDK